MISKFEKSIVVLTVMVGCFYCTNESFWIRSVVATQETHNVDSTGTLTFTGSASGGRLVLSETLNRNARHASIATTHGESAHSVAKRLSEAINESDPFNWTGGQGHPRTYASGASIKNLTGWGPDLTEFIIGGTESGLGIPKPPLFLSACYNADNNQILLRWINPLNAYDSILVLTNWSNYQQSSGVMIKGTSTKFVRDLNKQPVDVNDLDIWLIGFRNKIPSNAAAIHLNGNSQVELYGIPFTDNVAPNWKAWLMASDKNAVEFEQGVRERFLHKKDRTDNSIKHPVTKPFYQIVRTKTQDAYAGVWRKFMGLTPGHTYRVAIGINTLEMDSSKTAWEFSLHATYNAPDGSDLSVAQFAGLSSLPDGSKGSHAGKIALYHPGLTTKNTWSRRLTGKQWRDEFVPDITLPKGVDTITIWVRCWSAEPGAFAIDWVKLEDMTAKEPKKKQAIEPIKKMLK